MIKIYKENGLPFYDQNWIVTRQYLSTFVANTIQALLLEQNRAWIFEQIEAPSLIPKELVSKEYHAKDIYISTDDLFLKPETTSSSYAYANYLLEHQRATPPLCVWQLSKSFRRENDQVSANVRLKEFYQQEFQCIVTEDTKNNYQDSVIQQLAITLEKVLGTETRVIVSDRLPSYSTKTLDIEAKTTHKWLEVMSCSIRTDVPFGWNGKKLINYEFAFGADRLVYVGQQ